MMCNQLELHKLVCMLAGMHALLKHAASLASLNPENFYKCKLYIILHMAIFHNISQCRKRSNMILQEIIVVGSNFTRLQYILAGTYCKTCHGAEFLMCNQLVLCKIVCVAGMHALSTFYIYPSLASLNTRGTPTCMCSLTTLQLSSYTWPFSTTFVNALRKSSDRIVQLVMQNKVWSPFRLLTECIHCMYKMLQAVKQHCLFFSIHEQCAWAVYTVTAVVSMKLMMVEMLHIHHFMTTIIICVAYVSCAHGPPAAMSVCQLLELVSELVLESMHVLLHQKYHKCLASHVTVFCHCVLATYLYSSCLESLDL